MRLVIIRGVPGTGKTTIAGKIGALLIERDMFCRINGKYQWSKETAEKTKTQAYDLVRHVLSLGVDVTVAGTLVTADRVEEVAQIGRIVGADIIVIAMKRRYENVHGVPEETIRAMLEDWEDYPGERIGELP